MADDATIAFRPSRFSPELRRIREFLSRNRIPHEWLEPDRDAYAERVLREFGVTPDDLPVVLASGSLLRQPTPGSVAEYLGLTIESPPDRCFDLVVVGAGPAGLAAAVYGASEGLRTLLLEAVAVGGQAGTSSRIENYLGFPSAGQAAVFLAERSDVTLVIRDPELGAGMSRYLVDRIEADARITVRTNTRVNELTLAPVRARVIPTGRCHRDGAVG